MDKQNKMLRGLQTWRALNRTAQQIQPVQKYTNQSIHLCPGPSELLDVTDNNQDNILTVNTCYSCKNLKICLPTSTLHVYKISAFMPMDYYAHEKKITFYSYKYF